MFFTWFCICYSSYPILFLMFRLCSKELGAEEFWTGWLLAPVMNIVLFLAICSYSTLILLESLEKVSPYLRAVFTNLNKISHRKG